MSLQLSKRTKPTKRLCISNNLTFYLISIKGLIMDREGTIYYKLEKQSLVSKKNNKGLKKWTRTYNSFQTILRLTENLRNISERIWLSTNLLRMKKKSILSKFRILKDSPLSQVTHTILLNNKRRFSKEWQFFEKVPQEKKLIYNFFIKKYALLIWNMNSFLFLKKMT